MLHRQPGSPGFPKWQTDGFSLRRVASDAEVGHLRFHLEPSGNRGGP